MTSSLFLCKSSGFQTWNLFSQVWINKVGYYFYDMFLLPHLCKQVDNTIIILVRPCSKATLLSQDRIQVMSTGWHSAGNCMLSASGWLFVYGEKQTIGLKRSLLQFTHLSPNMHCWWATNIKQTWVCCPSKQIICMNLSTITSMQKLHCGFHE